MKARHTQYMMLALMQGTNYMFTTSIQHLVPFVIAAHSFPEAARGWLLSAFNLPYVLGQIPGSMLARTIGDRGPTRRRRPSVAIPPRVIPPTLPPYNAPH
jgi:MFS family permease